MSDTEQKLRPAEENVGRAPVLDYSTRRAKRVFDVSVESRVMGALFVFIPVAALLIFEGFAQPEWQSGKPGDILAILLGVHAGSYFWPFLGGATVSLMLVQWHPRWAAQQWWVRIGIAAGVVMSLHFVVLTMLFFTHAEPRLATISFGVTGMCGASALTLAWWKLRNYAPGRRALARLAAMGLILPSSAAVYVLCAFANGTLGDGTWILSARAALQVVELVIGTAIGMWPFWMLTVYVGALGLLIKYFQKLERRPWGFAWLEWPAWPLAAGLYGVAWQQAIQAAWEKYSWLPKEQPGGCYVVTAAAQGHPWLVGAEWRRDGAGRAAITSRQLRVLKSFELVFAVVAPSAHQVCRMVYNRIGPRLALCLRNRWLADAAYLGLKPLEWLAWLVCQAAGV